ncbi:transglycosylase domain-containing protein [Rothia sp. P6271]|uniref:transglycosylase domain-containing protein n=1 Tax=unclassified Rothia (in: high G+C Gram-positive bacteria) TaxID=2689056 RepID=UPI003AC3872E
MASSKNVRKKRTPSDFIQFIALSVIAGFVAAGILIPPTVGMGIAATSSISWFKGLPDDLSEGSRFKASTLYASDGKTKLASFESQRRRDVPLDQISKYMKDAIVSVEDRDFYEHGAVSPLGMARAFINNLIRPNNRQGASTLTQQYVNNLLIEQAEYRGEEASTLGSNKGYIDKIKEIKLAISMEQNKSKDEILDGYLNIVNLGGTNYGVEAASYYYWGIKAKDLNLQQSALLAGMVQSPNIYRPDVNPELAKERRNTVLGTMLRDKKITEDQFNLAVSSGLDLDIHTSKTGCVTAGDAAFFCDYVTAKIYQDEAYGATPEDRQKNLYRAGYTIVSTMSVSAQKDAKAAVEQTQPSTSNVDDINASLVSVEPSNGNVVAMAQNSDYGTTDDFSASLYNYNVDYQDGGTPGFQPGSTFKPVVLAEWLKEGKGVNATIDGTSLNYPNSFPWRASCLDGGVFHYSDTPNGFSFANAEEGFQRWGTVAFGIKNSINSFLYSMASKEDLCGIQDMAKALNMLTPKVGKSGGDVAFNPRFLASLIGGSSQVSPLTMASAYATFANDGVYCTPQAIKTVEDRSGKKIKTYDKKCHQAISKEIANGVSYVLKQVLVSGSGYQRGIGLPDASAAKTGTTDYSRQTWMIGYTRGLSTASWVGSLKSGSRSLNGLSINGKRLNYVDGATYAGAQWQTFMKEQAKNYNTDKFPLPPNEMLGTQQ